MHEPWPLQNLRSLHRFHLLQTGPKYPSKHSHVMFWESARGTQRPCPKHRSGQRGRVNSEQSFVSEAELRPYPLSQTHEPGPSWRRPTHLPWWLQFFGHNDSGRFKGVTEGSRMTGGAVSGFKSGKLGGGTLVKETELVKAKFDSFATCVVLGNLEFTLSRNVFELKLASKRWNTSTA